MYYAGAARIDFVEYGIELRSSGARPERYITQGDTYLRCTEVKARKKRGKTGNRTREG